MEPSVEVRDIRQEFGPVIAVDGVSAGDVDISHAKNPQRFAYAVPKEGSTLWIDSLAIPAKAAHPQEAYAFLSFVMEPEIAARIVNGVHYAGANRAALERISPEIRNDPSIHPPKEVLDRCELLEDLGETRSSSTSSGRDQGAVSGGKPPVLSY